MTTTRVVRAMKYDRNRHHRHSARLKDYDYSQAGAYFVTICAQDRECLFGEVLGEELRLNGWGRIVEEEWLRTASLRPNVELDAFVVMPNHIHAIVVINREGRGTARRAPTMERFGKPVSGSVPTIIRAFKSALTKRINAIRGTPGTPVWQRNYYEHVLRNQRELEEVREYIANNPTRWALDLENPTVRAGHGRTSAQ